MSDNNSDLSVMCRKEHELVNHLFLIVRLLLVFGFILLTDVGLNGGFCVLCQSWQSHGDQGLLMGVWYCFGGSFHLLSFGRFGGRGMIGFSREHHQHWRHWYQKQAIGWLNGYYKKGVHEYQVEQCVVYLSR